MPSVPSADSPHAVSGQVFDAYSGTIPNADVGLFVETSHGGLGWSVATDQNGQFLGYLRDSKISAIAWHDGFVQPCAVSAEVRGNVALQIEVTAVTTLDSVSPPRPLSVNGISLTGTIFEMTNGFRAPVAGAEVWIEHYDDIAVATTRSDLSGGYFACNLPTTVGIYVSKPGFRLAHVVVDPLQTPTRDILLQRE